MMPFGPTHNSTQSPMSMKCPLSAETEVDFPFSSRAKRSNSKPQTKPSTNTAIMIVDEHPQMKWSLTPLDEGTADGEEKICITRSP